MDTFLAVQLTVFKSPTSFRIFVALLWSFPSILVVEMLQSVSAYKELFRIQS